MALIELIFTLPKHDRNLTFDLIAQTTCVPKNQVEFLIIEAMSLELIKGTINQVEERVSIHWVIPRVLNKDRVKVMREKVSAW